MLVDDAAASSEEAVNGWQRKASKMLTASGPLVAPEAGLAYLNVVFDAWWPW
jgi:hypothetical protein